MPSIELTCAHCKRTYWLKGKPRAGRRFCSQKCNGDARAQPEARAARFWSYVEKTDSCWLWVGARDPQGYGRANHPKMLAHRLSWLMANGSLPSDMDVCHHCDNPPCVNPAHLFLGTRADNMQDCARKGRNVMQTRPGLAVRGESHHQHRLTEACVRDIRRQREEGVCPREIAKQYSVSTNTVYRIAGRRLWKHVA